MAALESRQDKVLEQLKGLKTLLMSTHASLGICAKPAQKPVIIKTENTGAQPVKEAAPKAPKLSNIKQRPINVCIMIFLYTKTRLKKLYFQTAYLQDIVINANPENVPYSLVALKKLWQNRLNITIRVCTHSSIVALSAAAIAFTEVLHRLAKDVDEASSLPNLNVLLIWKNVSHLEMVSSASNFFAIIGEVNILRYLNRIGPNEFSYDMVSLAESIEIDGALDLCTRLWATGSLKERQVVLQDLLKRLNGREYYGGEQLVLSDLAVSSSVKQLPKNIVPAQLSAWLARISPIVGY